MLQLIKPDINIDFMGKKKLLMTLSAILLVVALIPIVVRGGFNYGIDFSGGILVQVKFAKATDPTAIKHALKPITMDDSLVQSFGKAEDNEFLIRAQNPDLALEGLGDRVGQALKADYGPDGFEVRRIETVGPKVGKDLRQKALLAIFFSLLLMAVYISGRFEAKWVLAGVMAAVLAGVSIVEYWLLAEVMHLGESLVMVVLIVTCLLVTGLACWFLRLRYAMGAVVSLTHDVLITVGIFTMLGKEFNLSTVAAVLTIIGYSINDTIIVYDRVRENLAKGAKKSMEEVLNDSVNQTLSRTILTVGTVILVLISLYALGGSVIEDFALALLIGTAVGTYSSVYVASPMVLLIPAGGASLNLGALSKPKAAPAAPAKPAPRQAPRPAPRYEEADEEEQGEDGARPAARPSQVAAAKKARAKRAAGGKRKRR
jgi:preprotein translocase subunit SecF